MIWKMHLCLRDSCSGSRHFSVSHTWSDLPPSCRMTGVFLRVSRRRDHFFSNLEARDQLTGRKMFRFLLSPMPKSYFFTVCPHRAWRRKPYICSSLGFSAVYPALLGSVCSQWEVDKRESTRYGWPARRSVSTSSGKAGSRP